jgi:acetylornithine deacetylase/succinyl-diaminopimelate desuccinylase-like protein
VAAGEDGFSTLERVWVRPTAEVNGMWGGHTGAGPKTIVPQEAHAKVSFRLVDEQRPAVTQEAMRDHHLTDFTVPWTSNLAEQALRHVKIHLKISGGGQRARSRPAHRARCAGRLRG